MNGIRHRAEELGVLGGIGLVAPFDVQIGLVAHLNVERASVHPGQTFYKSAIALGDLAVRRPAVALRFVPVAAATFAAETNDHIVVVVVRVPDEIRPRRGQSGRLQSHRREELLDGAVVADEVVCPGYVVAGQRRILPVFLGKSVDAEKIAGFAAGKTAQAPGVTAAVPSWVGRAVVNAVAIHAAGTGHVSESGRQLHVQLQATGIVTVAVCQVDGVINDVSADHDIGVDRRGGVNGGGVRLPGRGQNESQSRAYEQ